MIIKTLYLCIGFVSLHLVCRRGRLVVCGKFAGHRPQSVGLENVQLHEEYIEHGGKDHNVNRDLTGVVKRSRSLGVNESNDRNNT